MQVEDDLHWQQGGYKGDLRAIFFLADESWVRICFGVVISDRGMITYSNFTAKHLALPALVSGHLRMC